MFFLFNALVTLSSTVIVEGCEYGEVALVGDQSQYEGRVEVCVNGQWNTICKDSFWDLRDAQIICRQLGFLDIDLGPNDNSRTYSGHSPGTGPILDSVECRGIERRLIECNYRYLSSNCNHDMDAGVQCRDGGTPTDVTYTINDNSIFLAWNQSLSSHEMLQDYSVTCLSWKELDQELSQHTVQVVVSNITTSVLIEGLYLDTLDYNCCVVADYESYSPRVCVYINTTTVDYSAEVYTTEASLETKSTTSNFDDNSTAIDDNDDIHYTNMEYQTEFRDVNYSKSLLIGGSAMGIFVLVFAALTLTSWTCTCLMYRKIKFVSAEKLQTRYVQSSSLDNPAYKFEEPLQDNQGDIHNQKGRIPQVHQSEASYEVVDLEPQAPRNSMIKSRYEFSELPLQTEETIFKNDHYEFCDVPSENSDVMNESSEPGVYFSHENLLNKTSEKKTTKKTQGLLSHGGYETMDVIVNMNDTYEQVRGRLQGEPLIKVEDENESKDECTYSATHVEDADISRTYSHTTIKSGGDEDGHQYSHTLILPENALSPGYLHLNTNTNNPQHVFSSKEGTSISDIGGQGTVVKGYSHLDVTEMTSPLVEDSEIALRSNPYQMLDISAMTSKPNEYATSSRKTKNSSKASPSSFASKSNYSSLNIQGVFENSLQHLEVTSDGYSHLNIETNDKTLT